MVARLLAGTLVGDVRRTIVTKAATIGPEAPVEELFEKILEDTRSRHVYVVDSAEVLLGSVRLEAVIKHLFPYNTSRTDSPLGVADLLRRVAARNIRDIMHASPRFVEDGTTLLETAKIMEEEHVNELPVVDASRRVVGEVNFLEVLAEYERLRKRIADLAG